MATAADSWYVRLPDGRTVRARNAEVLRGSIRDGRIPRDSQVRRSPAQQWQPLVQFAELAAGLEQRGAAVEPAGLAEPADAGLRGMTATLVTALERSFHRAKLTVAAVTGLSLALGILALDGLAGVAAEPLAAAGFFAAGLFVLAAAAVGTVLLTQMTFIELDRHRAARGAELRNGLGWQAFRVMVGQGAIAGLLIGLAIFFRAAGPWLAAHDLGDLNATRAGLITMVAVLRLLVEVLVVPLLCLALLLLGPVLAIEDRTIAQCIRDWLGLVRSRPVRIYLYETLALALAAVIALPLLGPVGVAAWALGEPVGLAERTTLYVLAGLALTPVIAYLSVANVFIYLNLRYEFFYTPPAQ